MSNLSEPTTRRKALLALGALGVVYGDIGTSPLYGLREALAGHAGHGALVPSPENVVGILSLIIWSLLTLITVKYISVVMRADNDGEGGMLALLALAVPHTAQAGTAVSQRNFVLVVLALLGTSFLFGEGIITPAISVLSAVEGLKVAAPPAMGRAIVPITVAILVGLFSIQHRGTGRVGTFFGPITLVWFISIGILGARGIVLHPGVLAAFNPWHGLLFLLNHGLQSAVTLGGVCLVITGGEALYADMGHFGRNPIRLAWFVVVLPALLLNYLGQGALVLSDPSAETLVSPLHQLAPDWFKLPLVILGAMAAVIASQALISGAFSLAMQAVQMGYLPRLAIKHTSESEHGQIYVPQVNRAIMVGSIALVLVFRTSSNLAAAYGIAVCLTMFITTILLSQIALHRWHWPWWKTVLICGIFMVIEVGFVTSNLLKIKQGGWVPLGIGAVLLLTMLTWKRGRAVLAGKFAEMSLPMEDLIGSLERGGVTRVRGTAVYLSTSVGFAPPALLHNLKHNQVLHDKTIILTIQAVRTPRVTGAARLEVEELGLGVWRVVARYGFMEHPEVPAVLVACAGRGLSCRPDQVSYFLGRETIIPTRRNIPLWQAKYFALLSRGSQSAMEFFKLPPNRVIELGTQIEM
ncbi:MAG: potassium transporter Kup [Verrucomicrobia bacterium]|nr:potassium transporter Kup [Verrucomicrobiota bacterium]